MLFKSCFMLGMFQVQNLLQYFITRNICKAAIQIYQSIVSFRYSVDGMNSSYKFIIVFLLITNFLLHFVLNKQISNRNLHFIVITNQLFTK